MNLGDFCFSVYVLKTATLEDDFSKSFFYLHGKMPEDNCYITFISEDEKYEQAISNNYILIEN